MLGHALKNKVNILDIKFKKGVIGVIPKSEKSGRSHRPAAQPEQLDTFQEAEPQAPSDDASSSYDDDVTQAYEEEFEEELEDTPNGDPQSFSFLSSDPRHVNNGYSLVNQVYSQEFGPVEQAGGLDELAQKVQLRESRASAYEPDSQPPVKPAAAQADKPSPAEPLPKFLVGGVELTESQLMAHLCLGRVTALRMTPKFRKQYSQEGTSRCPKCGQPLYRRNIKPVEFKATWLMGVYPEIILFPVYRCDLVCSNEQCEQHGLGPVSNRRFTLMCGEHEFDSWHSTSDFNNEFLLSKLNVIVRGDRGKEIPALLNKALFDFTIQQGVKLALDTRGPRIDPDKDVILPDYIRSMGPLAGFNQVFSKTHVTIQFLSQLLGIKSTAAIAQHAAHTLFDCNFYVGGEKVMMPVNYSQLNTITIGVIRAYFCPGMRAILGTLMNQANGSSTLCMDESPLKHRLNNLSKVSQGYIWATISSSTAKYQVCAAWFYPNRNTAAFTDLVTMFKDNLEVFNILSDAFCSYDAGLNIFEEDYGTKCCHAKCMSHARREVFEALEQTPDLLKIYEIVKPKSDSDLKSAKISEFLTNLDLFNKDPAQLDVPEHLRHRTLTEVEQSALAWYFLTNRLFALERYVNELFADPSLKESLELRLKVRHDKSVELMAYIRHIIANLIYKHDCVLIKENKNGTVSYRRKGDILISKALIYWGRNWCNLCCFLDDAGIDISNNKVERKFRRPTLAKRNSKFFNGLDGAQAFTVLHAMSHNCHMLDINAFDYFVWLICNIQRRLFRNQEQINADLKLLDEANKADIPGRFMAMPKKRTDKNGDADGQGYEIVYDIFDMDHNQTIYDLVDLKGLLPQDYKAMLVESKVKSLLVAA